MSSETFLNVGPGKALAYLRGALANARRSLIIIGPWIDSYFAAEVVKASSDQLNVRVLLRSKSQVETDVWDEMIKAIRIFSGHWTQVEVRTLERLHAKCIVIDEEVAFIGSTNWYRYSLESRFEVLVRAALPAITGLSETIENFWEQSSIVDVKGWGGENKAGPGIERDMETLDPLARKAMRQNPKAWVVRKKGT